MRGCGQIMLTEMQAFSRLNIGIRHQVTCGDRRTGCFGEGEDQEQKGMLICCQASGEKSV